MSLTLVFSLSNLSILDLEIEFVNTSTSGNIHKFSRISLSYDIGRPQLAIYIVNFYFKVRVALFLVITVSMIFLLKHTYFLS
jgi:hypothetical protein